MDNDQSVANAGRRRGPSRGDFEKREGRAARLGAVRRAAQGPRPDQPAGQRPHGQRSCLRGVARRYVGPRHGHGRGGGKSYIIEFFYCAVLVLGAELGVALAPECRRVRRLGGRVRVGVQGQYPRLRQQRAPEAKQQQQGNTGAYRLHNIKVAFARPSRGSGGAKEFSVTQSDLCSIFVSALLPVS